jgi:hypothetical protein
VRALSCHVAQDFESDRVAANTQGQAVATSAAQRALRLPEIVTVILSELHGSGCANAGYIYRLDAPSAVFDDDDRVVPAYAAHASLRAAALANRTWCDAALRLLWRTPSELALADDIGLTKADRVGYARLIREVHIYWRSPLWRALGEVGDTETPVASIGNDVHGGISRSLDLPLLQVLRMAHCTSRRREENDTRRWRWFPQVSLEWMISPQLVELSCAITATALTKLTEMLENALPKERLHLRMLQLHGHPDNSTADQTATRRVFELLAHNHDMAPQLRSIKLQDLEASAMLGLCSWVFRNLWFRPGLQQLWLSDAQPHSGNVVTLRDIERAAANVRPSSDSHHNYSNSQRERGMRGRVEGFQDLRISADSQAIGPLVRLVESLTSLALHVELDVDPGAVSAPAFTAMARLRKLRHLEVQLPLPAVISPEDICALKHLVQLRELAIIDGHANSLSDRHIEELLRPLCLLSLFILTCGLPALS